MDTLYDLLGALPHDDAESLRVAFRKAAKGAHPDLRPGDPDAGLKFRQIVRANQILADSEQRAAYDHLLMLARIEKDPASAHPIAARIHRLASGVMAIAIASIVTVGGYLVFMHMSMALVAPEDKADVSTRERTQVASLSPIAPSASAEVPLSIPAPDAAGEMIVPRTAPVIQVESLPPINVGGNAPADPAPNEARDFRSRGIWAYRNGDLDGAIIDLDQAIQLNPKSSASYIDRGVVFYRMRKYDRAFADLARAKQIETKQIEKGRSSKPSPGQPRKLHLEQALASASAKPKPKPLPQPPRPVAASYSQSTFEPYPSGTFQ